LHWQHDRQQHTILLNLNQVALPTVELRTSECLSSEYNWTHCFNEAIELLVKEGVEVYEPVPLYLTKAYLQRNGLVMKFNKECLGGVVWIKVIAATRTATNKEGTCVVKDLPHKAMSNTTHAHLESFESYISHYGSLGHLASRVAFQPYIESLNESETRMYYSFDTRDNIHPLAEMMVNPKREVLVLSGNVVYRLRDKVKKNWREKVTGFNFKEKVGLSITNPVHGLYQQPFLPIRVDCFCMKSTGRQEHLVNSMGIFPLVGIEAVNADHNIATLVIDQYCKWAETSLTNYPIM
jgi:hypothetical protein